MIKSNNYYSYLLLIFTTHKNKHGAQNNRDTVK